MNVLKERFVDAGTKDENGYYDFYYSGFHWQFDEDGQSFRARQYDETLDEVSLDSFELVNRRHLIFVYFGGIPYDNALFRKATLHLILQENIRKIKILMMGGYEEVDVSKLCE